MDALRYEHTRNRLVESELEDAVLCSRADADRILLWAMTQGATPGQATSHVVGVLMPRALVDLYMGAVAEERKPADYGYGNDE